MARTVLATVPPSFPAVVRCTETHEIAVRVAAPDPAAAVRLAARAWRDGDGELAFRQRGVDNAAAGFTHIRVMD